jgi:hypothetical protein
MTPVPSKHSDSLRIHIQGYMIGVKLLTIVRIRYKNFLQKILCQLIGLKKAPSLWRLSKKNDCKVLMPDLTESFDPKSGHCNHGKLNPPYHQHEFCRLNFRLSTPVYQYRHESAPARLSGPFPWESFYEQSQHRHPLLQ